MYKTMLHTYISFMFASFVLQLTAIVELPKELLPVRKTKVITFGKDVDQLTDRINSTFLFEEKEADKQKQFIKKAIYTFAGKSCSPILLRERIIHLWLTTKNDFFRKFTLDDIYFALRFSAAFEEHGKIQEIEDPA